MCGKYDTTLALNASPENKCKHKFQPGYATWDFLMKIGRIA